jgi:hypothetical protein
MLEKNGQEAQFPALFQSADQAARQQQKAYFCLFELRW